MSPVPGKGYAANALPITAGIMNCPAVFSQRPPNVLTTVLPGDLSKIKNNGDPIPGSEWSKFPIELIDGDDLIKLFEEKELGLKNPRT